MGRKDAAGGSNKHSYSPPMENYRKEIGKHDRKLKRASAKEMKNQSDAKKSAMTVWDVAWMLGAFLLLTACVYFVFYAFIISQDKETKED